VAINTIAMPQMSQTAPPWLCCCVALDKVDK
jgi:hypothetical protein